MTKRKNTHPTFAEHMGFEPKIKKSSSRIKKNGALEAAALQNLGLGGGRGGLENFLRNIGLIQNPTTTPTPTPSPTAIANLQGGLSAPQGGPPRPTNPAATPRSTATPTQDTGGVAPTPTNYVVPTEMPGLSPTTGVPQTTRLAELIDVNRIPASVKNATGPVSLNQAFLNSYGKMAFTPTANTATQTNTPTPNVNATYAADPDRGEETRTRTAELKEEEDRLIRENPNGSPIPTRTPTQGFVGKPFTVESDQAFKQLAKDYTENLEWIENPNFAFQYVDMDNRANTATEDESYWTVPRAAPDYLAPNSTRNAQIAFGANDPYANPSNLRDAMGNKLNTKALAALSQINDQVRNSAVETYDKNYKLIKDLQAWQTQWVNDPNNREVNPATDPEYKAAQNAIYGAAQELTRQEQIYRNSQGYSWGPGSTAYLPGQGEINRYNDVLNAENAQNADYARLIATQSPTFTPSNTPTQTPTPTWNLTQTLAALGLTQTAENGGLYGSPTATRTPIGGPAAQRTVVGGPAPQRTVIGGPLTTGEATASAIAGRKTGTPTPNATNQRATDVAGSRTKQIGTWVAENPSRRSWILTGTPTPTNGSATAAATQAPRTTTTPTRTPTRQSGRQEVNFAPDYLQSALENAGYASATAQGYGPAAAAAAAGANRKPATITYPTSNSQNSGILNSILSMFAPQVASAAERIDPIAALQNNTAAQVSAGGGNGAAAAAAAQNVASNTKSAEQLAKEKAAAEWQAKTQAALRAQEIARANKRSQDQENASNETASNVTNAGYSGAAAAAAAGAYGIGGGSGGSTGGSGGSTGGSGGSTGGGSSSGKGGSQPSFNIYNNPVTGLNLPPLQPKPPKQYSGAGMGAKFARMPSSNKKGKLKKDIGTGTGLTAHATQPVKESPMPKITTRYGAYRFPNKNSVFNSSNKYGEKLNMQQTIRKQMTPVNSKQTTSMLNSHQQMPNVMQYPPSRAPQHVAPVMPAVEQSLKNNNPPYSTNLPVSQTFQKLLIAEDSNSNSITKKDVYINKYLQRKK